MSQVDISKLTELVVEGPDARLALSKLTELVVEGPDARLALSKLTELVVEGPLDLGNLEATKASFQAAAEGDTNIQASKAGLQAAALSLSREVQGTQANYTIPVEQQKTFQAGKAGYQVVCLGRKELPNMLAWTATLDGHDYYVLQLSDLTLVYDLHSEQWYNWASADREIWRAQIGTDWNANLGHITGQGGELGATSIIVGDYITGALYFLDMSLNEDESPDEPGVTIPFQRVVYGQLAMRGIDYVPCNGVQLTSSAGEAVSAHNMDVDLSFSDDQGHTFTSAGALSVQGAAHRQKLHWRSLGSFRGPGRLFKVTDWGALTRIDGMDMDDGQSDG